MAESPAHKFGQLIGELIESIIRPRLESFCAEHNLYLDFKQRNRTARSCRNVSWVDKYGNKHDLDYVIEKNGSDGVVGSPVAFIEVAWRRYTKHSRNKVQEIQGAILPLAETYKFNYPFLGAVLAGVFTNGSIEQLQSLGFTVLYLPYETIISAFKSVGIDIRFDESTPDSLFSRTVKKVERRAGKILPIVSYNLINSNAILIDKFYDTLRSHLSRLVIRIVITPLYGQINEFETLEEAIVYIENYKVTNSIGEFRKFEIHVDYSNGDKIDAYFESQSKVKEFLEFVQVQ